MSSEGRAAQLLGALSAGQLKAWALLPLWDASEGQFGLELLTWLAQPSGPVVQLGISPYLPSSSLPQVLILRALLNKHSACHTISDLHRGRAQPVTGHTDHLGIRFWLEHLGAGLRFSMSNKLLGDAYAVDPSPHFEEQGPP